MGAAGIEGFLLPLRIMAGEWIKINKSLPRDPRVICMASALKADRFRTVGGLVAAWCLFDEQTEDGVLEGYTPELLDEVVGFPGLAEGMESVGWLVVGQGFLEMPRFEEHNSKSAKRRAQEAVRKASARKAEDCPHEKRTKSGLEKSREDIGESKSAGEDGWAERIVSSYPRRERFVDALRIVAKHIEQGEDPEQMLAGVKAAAAVIKKAPSGSSNRYVPGAFAYFEGKRWKDDPETLIRTGNQSTGAPKGDRESGLRKIGRRGQQQEEAQ